MLDFAKLAYLDLVYLRLSTFVGLFHHNDQNFLLVMVSRSLLCLISVSINVIKSNINRVLYTVYETLLLSWKTFIDTLNLKIQILHKLKLYFVRPAS